MTFHNVHNINNMFCQLVSHIEEMEVVNFETLKIPIQESCGEEAEKDLRTPDIKEKKIPQENDNHYEESSFTSKRENPYSVP